MDLIQEIGSYAGFAAILGLAVLSALYFSQSRDVKRLREWAGRAPERDAEARSRVAAAGNLRQTPAAQAQQSQAAAAAAKPAAAAGSGNSGSASPAAPAKAGVAAGAAGAGAASGGSGRGAVASPARPGRVSAQTSILKPEDKPRERWYRTPRYIALLIAGVLVVGGGIAVGVLQLLGNDSGSPSGSTTGTADRGQALAPQNTPAAPVQPGDINVAVLNATTSQGLATQFGDQAERLGFQRGSVGNYTGAQRAESVVMYKAGHAGDARFVRRKFDISAIEPADAVASKTAPSADVVVVIGADKAGG